MPRQVRGIHGHLDPQPEITMLISHARRIKFRGAPADLRVIRNDGYCWGLIVTGDKAVEVETKADHYDRIDDDALDAFERASRNPKCLCEPVRTWNPALLTDAELELGVY